MQFKRNIVANFIGKSWPAFTAVVCVPQYVRLMGIEAYGLVGFFATLQSVCSLADMGFGATINREVARLSPQVGKAQETRDLVRTLEVIYWVAALTIAGAVVLLAPPIAHSWIQSRQLPGRTVQDAVLLMGLAIAFQFPSTLYAGGLLGLQRQVLFNGITITMVTVRAVGAILVLKFFSTSIIAFFCWQAFMSVALTLVSAVLLWQGLPIASFSGRFKARLLSGVWRFAIGLSGITILGMILTQLDKVILSRILTLELFGYYSLATVVAGGLYMFASPVYTAVFPRFSQLVVQGDREALKQLYHQSCQLVAVAVLPAAMILAIFAKELLLIWTGNAVTAEQTHLLVSLLVLGTALNTLAITPQALQLAYGWTSLALYENLVAVALLVPLVCWLDGQYGAIGGAAVWIILNAGYVFIGMPLMHRSLLKEELGRWYACDVGLPWLAALLVALIGRWLYPGHLSAFATLGWIGVVSMLTLGAAIALTPYPRQWMRQYMSGWKTAVVRGDCA